MSAETKTSTAVKFEFTDDTIKVGSVTLTRIRATIEFSDIKAGDLGGYIEKRENLAEEGDAWVYGDARVFGNAWVYGDARVFGDARVSNGLIR